MKNTTLLKVLSASAIFTAIAAIESYDHNAFATEVSATANNTQSDVETKTVPQDVKNLADGTYNITSEALKFYGKDGEPSMAAAGLDKDNTKLIVKNGQYSVNVAFKPIKLGAFNGYLGDLKYYDGDKTHSNRYDIQDNEFKDTTIVGNYSENEKDPFINVYKKKFPGRTVYPKTLSYNVDKNKIDANNKLETFTQVFVPVMEALPNGSGTQRMILNYDLSSLATKTITVPKVDTKKLAKEKAEKERIERERLAKEKAEKERIERERLAKEKAEKERIEREKLAKEKAEKEKLEREKAEADRLEKERLDKEAAAKAQAEKERLEKEKAQKAEAARLEKERLDKEAAAKAQAEKERLEKEAAAKAEKERLEKEAATKVEKERLEKKVKAVEKTVTELKDNKAQLEKLVKEKEEAINNATTEVEKEKLTMEKAAVEKELTAKVTELKAENEKAVNLKFEAVKKHAVGNILKDKSLSDKEIKQLEAIVENASLKDTLVAKVVENDPSEDVTVTFDNTAIKADKLVVQKVDKKIAAKVEELVKKADKNLSVVKTIDLHFESNNTTINKQGETRAVTITVVANTDEKLEVYYVRETDDKNIVLEKVPSAYKDGKLTFFTNHFSPYTIVKPNPEKPSTSDASSTSTNGNTSAGTETPKSSEVNPDKTPAQSGEQASSQNKALNKENADFKDSTDVKDSQDKKETTSTPKPLINDIFGQSEVKDTFVATPVSNKENTKNTLDIKKSLANTGTTAATTGFFGLITLLTAFVLRRKVNK